VSSPFKPFATVGIVLAVQTLVALASAAAPVLAPVVAADLQVSLYGLGLFVALTYAFASVSGLMAGMLVDRYGALRICIACLMLTSLAMTIGAAAPGSALPAVAVLMGCAYGPINVAASDLLYRMSPPERRNTLFSLKQTSVPAGNALAGASLPLLSGLAGWRGALAAVALAAAGLMLLLLAYQRHGAAAVSMPARHDGGIAALRLVLERPALRQCILAATSFSALQICFTSFLVSYLVGHAQLTLIDAGLVLSTALVAGVVGRIVWGIAADTVVRAGTLLGGLGLAMSMMAVLPAGLGADWPLLALVATGAVCGFVVAGWNGVYFAEICRVAPSDAVNRATAAASFFTFGSAVVAPAVFSAILAASDSYAIAYLVFGAAGLVSALSFFFRAA
jgi:MFS family permease